MGADIKFLVKVDSKKGQASIKGLDQQVDKLEKTTKKSAAGFKELAGKLAIGIAGIYGAIRALRGLTRFMGDAIDKAATQELAEKEVAAALESTGREVEKNTEHFKAYASQLQSATTYGDEQVLSAQAMLLQLTNLDRKGLDRATQGALGLASVYKTDLKAATVLVGKALAGNYGALSRYGIMVERSMTDEQKRISILEQLAIMYQRAMAETETYQGSIQQLSNVWGDLKEKIGDVIIKNEAIKKGIKYVKKAIEEFIASGKIEEYANKFTLHLSAIIEAFKAVKKAFETTNYYLFGYWDRFKKGTELTKEFIAETNMMAEAMRMRKMLIKNEIVTTEEWTEIFNRHGRRYARVLRAISTLPAYKEIRERWTEIKEDIDKVRQTPDEEVIIHIIPRIETSAFEEARTKLFNLIDNLQITAEGADILDYEWNQSMGNIEEGTTNFVNKMIEDMNSMGVNTGLTQEQMIKGWQMWKKESLKQLSDFELAIVDFITLYEQGFEGILQAAKRWAAAEAVKWIMAQPIPFPIKIPMAIAAIAGIEELYKTISGLQEGAIFDKPTYLRNVVVGEAGTEILAPEKKLSSITKESVREVIKEGGNMTISLYNSITINTKTLDDRTIQEAGEKIFRQIDYEARRRGWRLNGGH